MSGKHHAGQKHDNPDEQASDPPPSPPKGISKTNNPDSVHESTCNERKPTKWWRSPEIWTAIGTVMLATFGIPSAVFLYLQLKESHEALVVDQRAWVGPVRIGEMIIQAEKPGFASMIITNSGKTPALNVTTTMSMSYASSSTPIEEIVKTIEPNSAGDATRDVIFPGVVNPLPADTHGLILGEERINKLKSGEAALYILGVIEYSDVFSSTVHTTKFCGKINRSLTAFGNCPNFKSVAN